MSGYSSFSLSATLSVWMRANWDRRNTARDYFIWPSIRRAREQWVSMLLTGIWIKQSHLEKGAIVRLQPLSLWQGARGVSLFKHTEARIGTRHVVKVAHSSVLEWHRHTVPGSCESQSGWPGRPCHSHPARTQKRQRGLKLLFAFRIFLPPHAHTLL